MTKGIFKPFRCKVQPLVYRVQEVAIVTVTTRSQVTGNLTLTRHYTVTPGHLDWTGLEDTSQ